MDCCDTCHPVNYELVDITVVGLGLMGGSYAKALHRLRPGHIWGVDKDRSVLLKAVSGHVIDGGSVEAREHLSHSQFVIICLPPADTVAFIRDHMDDFMGDSVVTDICGLKEWVIKETKDAWRPDVTFIPGHPMTGREGWGYDRSDKDLFKCCNYILTPLPGTPSQAISMVADMARGIGSGRIVLSDPVEHDKFMAATSHLPHIIAAAYLSSQWEEGLAPFTGGSFRDMTRVAQMNTPLWAELLSHNASHILSQIGQFEKEISALKRSIQTGNIQEIRACLDAMTVRAEEVRDA